MSVLRQGDTNSDVDSLHQRLIELGYSLDGTETDSASFGPTTLAAVLDVQKQADIDQDGVVGPRTLQALTDATSGPTPADWRFDIDIARTEVKPTLLAAYADLKLPTIEVPKGSNTGPRVNQYWSPGSKKGDPGPGDSWCAAAASTWVRACTPDPIGKILASAWKWYEWGDENHALITNGSAIIPGDIGVMLRPYVPGKSRQGHVEIVVANLGDGRLADIGGNVGDQVSATVRPRAFFNYIVRPVRLIPPPVM